MTAAKPTVVKKLENHPNKRKIETGEPEPDVIELRPPKHFDEEMLKAWYEFEPILRKYGLLTEADKWLFENLCTARARLLQIQNAIKNLNEQQDMNGLVNVDISVSGDGEEFVKVTQSAYATMERQYFEIFRKYAIEFGLTPKGRVGLQLKALEKQKDDAAF